MLFQIFCRRNQLLLFCWPKNDQTPIMCQNLIPYYKLLEPPKFREKSTAFCFELKISALSEDPRPFNVVNSVFCDSHATDICYTAESQTYTSGNVFYFSILYRYRVEISRFHNCQMFPAHISDNRSQYIQNH